MRDKHHKKLIDRLDTLLRDIQKVENTDSVYRESAIYLNTALQALGTRSEQPAAEERL